MYQGRADARAGSQSKPQSSDLPLRNAPQQRSQPKGQSSRFVVGSPRKDPPPFPSFKPPPKPQLAKAALARAPLPAAASTPVQTQQPIKGPPLQVQSKPPGSTPSPLAGFPLPVSTSYYGLKPFTNYINEIYTFSAPNPRETYHRLRATLQEICNSHSLDWYNVTVPIPAKETPFSMMRNAKRSSNSSVSSGSTRNAINHSSTGGTASLIFADRIMNNDAAMLMFFNPWSEIWWFQWPGSTINPSKMPNQHSLDDILSGLVKQGKLKQEHVFRPGQPEYKRVWEIARRAAYEVPNKESSMERGASVEVIEYSKGDKKNVLPPGGYFRKMSPRVSPGWRAKRECDDEFNGDGTYGYRS